MQTNKLKSGRSGTNPIIREKLISLPAAASATVSSLPPHCLVQGQWVKKLANKIRKFNYSSAVSFQEVACHTSLCRSSERAISDEPPCCPSISLCRPPRTVDTDLLFWEFRRISKKDEKRPLGKKKECHYPSISFSPAQATSALASSHEKDCSGQRLDFLVL